jgi:hypothetical protein
MNGQGDAGRCRRDRAGRGLTAWALYRLCGALLPAQVQYVRDTPIDHDATPLRSLAFRLVPAEAAFAPVQLDLWLALPRLSPPGSGRLQPPGSWRADHGLSRPSPSSTSGGRADARRMERSWEL